jgi:ferredoxin
MRITVDHDVCEANGLCEEVSDELFHLRDDDVLHILMPKPSSDELIAMAREAFRVCPKAALRLIEDA